MPPAARVGDLTSHGTPLTPLTPVMGSQNVLIGGQPAGRAVIDFHTCPQANGTQPHVGGNRSIGSLTVLINKGPAGRQGDTITEPGGRKKITAGLTTVVMGG